jgi:hypothetical protein
VKKLVDAYVRSTLDCGGSTPLWPSSSASFQGGVEPPHFKALRANVGMITTASARFGKAK